MDPAAPDSAPQAGHLLNDYPHTHTTLPAHHLQATTATMVSGTHRR